MDPRNAGARSASGQTGASEPQGRVEAGVDVYEVVFQKGEHQWRFRYVGGEEAVMIEAVRDIMRRDGGLDWVDLALVVHEIRSGTSIEIVRKKEGIL
jgi:hypothetical protein